MMPLLAGFLGGILAVALCGGSWYAFERFTKPAHRAGLRRAVKFLGFQVAGLVLANGAYVVTSALLHTSLDPATVQIVGAGIGSVAAGAQKSRSWQEVAAEYNVDPQTIAPPSA